MATHPVDELGEIRQQIADLKKREDELRNQILSQRCSMTGERWEAQARAVERRYLDRDKIKREVGEERFGLMFLTSEIVMVRVAKR